MKKILAVVLLSLSIAYLTGCTPVENNVSSAQPSQESLQISQDAEKSDNEKSNNEKSNDEKSNDEKSNDEKSNESDDENSEEESSEIDIMEESDIFSFRVKINDVVYQLPFEYAELEENGYYISRDGELEPENYSRSIEWKNEEGHIISTQLWNPSNKKKSYEECKIGSMEIKLGEDFEVVLPGNFAFDTEVTPAKIKEQYGEPESEHIYNDYVTLRYKVDLSKTVEFFIYTNENYIKFSSVTVKNFS